MLSVPSIDAFEPETPRPMVRTDRRGQILQGVFELFDKSDIRYCVLHGYENYPNEVRSDVDCVIDERIKPQDLYLLFHRNSTLLGADLIDCKGYHVVLAARDADGDDDLLTLDMAVNSSLGDLTFYSGREILDDRQACNGFWIPVAKKEFAAYLAMSIVKRRFEEERTRRLQALYGRDPRGCEQEARRFWSERTVDLLVSAVRSHDWSEVEAFRGRILSELRGRARRRFPLEYIKHKLVRAQERIGQIAHPDGLTLAILGPDGSGKSTCIASLENERPALFRRSVVWGFPPPLHRLMGRNDGPSKEPQGLPSRSIFHSLLRSIYWLVYSRLNEARVWFVKARSGLVMYDRHLVDILVDPKRYRYSGPKWYLRAVWYCSPKPDLIILLHADPEVVFSRKQELSLKEIVRQEKAYLSLVKGLASGRVVSASKSLDQVLGELRKVLFQFLKERTAVRLGLASEGNNFITRQRDFLELV